MRPGRDSLRGLRKKEHMKMGTWDKGGFWPLPIGSGLPEALGEALLSPRTLQVRAEKGRNPKVSPFIESRI